MQYSIYSKGNNQNLIWTKTIYQHWDEEDIPYKRRAKREFKKFKEKHPNIEFYLIEEEK